MKGAILSKTNPPNPRRGQVWNVDFNPAKGTELQKIRPAVVISSDGIGRLPIKLVAPVTGWQEHFFGNIWHVRIDPNRTNGLAKVSSVDTLQIRGVDVRRFIRQRGRLNATLMEEITAAIAVIIEFQLVDTNDQATV